MHPLNEHACGLEHDKHTKNIQTPYFHISSRRAWYDLPQTFHGDRGRREHYKGVDPRYRQFFLHGAQKIWG